MSAQTTRPDRFVVAYRTGGTMMCRWHRILDTFESKEAAKAKIAELDRAGYRAVQTSWHNFVNIGMPIGWEPHGIDWENDHICYVVDSDGHAVETRWTSRQLHS